MRRNPLAGGVPAFLIPMVALIALPFIVSPSAADFTFRHAIQVSEDVAQAVQLLDVKGKPSTGGGGVPTNYGCAVLPAGKVITTQAGVVTILQAPTSVCYLCDMKTPNTCTVTSPETLKGAKFLK